MQSTAQATSQAREGENSPTFVEFHQRGSFPFFLPLSGPFIKLLHLDIQINDVSFPYANGRGPLLLLPVKVAPMIFPFK